MIMKVILFYYQKKEKEKNIMMMEKYNLKEIIQMEKDGMVKVMIIK